MATKDEVFDEVSTFNVLLKKILDDELCKNEAETKWMKIFNGNDYFSLLFKLVTIVSFLPVSDAFVVWVVVLVSAQWLDKKNRLYEKNIKSLLQIKVNLDYNCRQLYWLISKNEQLMKQIVSDANYATK